MCVGIAADHAGFALKKQLTKALRESGHEVVDFGSSSLTPEDDYPDYVVLPGSKRGAWRGGVRGGDLRKRSGSVRHCQQGERSTGGVDSRHLFRAPGSGRRRHERDRLRLRSFGI
jgi:hypothetical protein